MWLGLPACGFANHTEQLFAAPLGGPEVTRVLEATGLSGVEQLAGVSGLDREGYVSRSALNFKGDPGGLLRLFDQKPLTAADLAVLPRDATFAVAKSVDLEKAFATALGVLVEEVDPRAGRRPWSGQPARVMLAGVGVAFLLRDGAEGTVACPES